MRILIVVDCYLPSTKSVAQLTHDLARELVRRGNAVTVLTPSAEQRETVSASNEDGVHVLRYRTGNTKGASLAVRAMNEMLISLVALWRTRGSLGSGYEYVVFYSPSIFFGPLVAYLRRRWGAATYLILRDIFPDWAVDAGILRKGLAYRLFKVFERVQYEAADTIGVETSGSFRYFDGTPFVAKTELLRNWTTCAPPVPLAESMRSQLGLEGKVVFFYGGNLGVAQDMDNIIRLARRMAAREDVHFLLVGDGSERPRLTQLVQREEMTNVTILGPVPPEAYMSMLSEFDVGLITLDRRLRTFSNTGKLLGYLRCGLPVLASYNLGNDLCELLEQSGAGLGSVNGEDDLFYENALQLCDATTRRAMGERARGLLHERFSVEQIATQILTRYQASLPGEEPPRAQ